MNGLTMETTKNGRKYFTNETGEVTQMECTKCRKIHDVSFFSHHTNGFINKRSSCKQCVREYVKSYNKRFKAVPVVKTDVIEYVIAVAEVDTDVTTKEMILYKQVSSIRQHNEADITKQFDAFAGKVPFDSNDLISLALKELLEKYGW